MKTLILFLSLSAPALAAGERPVSCSCHYMHRIEWHYVETIKFTANRTNYQKVGEAACLAKARDVILDPEWDNETVTISECRFTN